MCIILIYATKCIFSRITFTFPLRRWVFSRALARGTRRGAARTHGSSLDAGRGSWSCSQGSKMRILASKYGEAFRPARSKQDYKNLTIRNIYRCFWLLAARSGLITPSHELSIMTQPRNSGSCTSSSSFRDGHGRRICVCMWAVMPAHLDRRNGFPKSQQRGALFACAAQGAGLRYEHKLSW